MWVQSVDLNSYLNTKTNLKKLQYGVDKCVKMHIGCSTTYCPDLYIDQWKMKKVDEARCDSRNLEDMMDGEHLMEITDE